ncbi:hypothetical protein [Pseudomonas sp. MWU12-2037]|uniref:hypothetical protein n=1 Tax=Pseudomonas sp. MWU12-2037 TaxID=2928690 RepID=UPI00201021FA|nr:hypothetical protein [Pseudomonas sp. MWU12-2037]
MKTQPEAWNIKIFLGDVLVEIPEPREQYEAALIRMKVGEILYIKGQKVRVVNKDVVSALSIANRSYRVNVAFVANVSTEATSPESGLPRSKAKKESHQEEPVTVTKIKNGSIMASWGSWENFASAYLSKGDIITYAAYPDQRNEIIGVEYYDFAEDGFLIRQVTELLS